LTSAFVVLRLLLDALIAVMPFMCCNKKIKATKIEHVKHSCRRLSRKRVDNGNVDSNAFTTVAFASRLSPCSLGLICARHRFLFVVAADVAVQPVLAAAAAVVLSALAAPAGAVVILQALAAAAAAAAAAGVAAQPDIALGAQLHLALRQVFARPCPTFLLV
jgi:hypothetical protein